MLSHATAARADRPAPRANHPEPTPAEARVLAIMADPARRGWSPDRLATLAGASPADAARVYLRLAAGDWRLPAAPARLRVVAPPDSSPEPLPVATSPRPARYVTDRAGRDAFHAELARLRDAGDVGARNRLVEANLPLARRLAAQALARVAPGDHALFDDLCAEANCGLLRAAEKFDGARGVAFSTYAVFWIKQSIVRYLTTSNATIHVPAWTQLKDAAAKSRRAAGHVAAARAARSCRPVGGPALVGDPDPLDLLVARAEAGPEPAERSVALMGFLDGLPGGERGVLVRSFGLDGEPAATQQAIGAGVGLTRGRINQIYLRGLDSLRARFAERGITTAADL